ncbi:hypothetical protein K9K77_02680 [Candidatus Babeliales bacterium]|nr:hypothetical protein [Candidatus Babeliales bacterium]
MKKLIIMGCLVFKAAYAIDEHLEKALQQSRQEMGRYGIGLSHEDELSQALKNSLMQSTLEDDQALQKVLNDSLHVPSTLPQHVDHHDAELERILRLSAQEAFQKEEQEKADKKRVAQKKQQMERDEKLANKIQADLYAQKLQMERDEKLAQRIQAGKSVASSASLVLRSPHNTKGKGRALSTKSDDENFEELLQKTQRESLMGAFKGASFIDDGVATEITLGKSTKVWKGAFLKFPHNNNAILKQLIVPTQTKATCGAHSVSNAVRIIYALREKEFPREALENECSHDKNIWLEPLALHNVWVRYGKVPVKKDTMLPIKAVFVDKNAKNLFNVSAGLEQVASIKKVAKDLRETQGSFIRVFFIFTGSRPDEKIKSNNKDKIFSDPLGHWYTLVLYQQIDAITGEKVREYVVADSLGNMNRLADDTVHLIINIIECGMNS